MFFIGLSQIYYAYYTVFIVNNDRIVFSLLHNEILQFWMIYPSIMKHWTSITNLIDTKMQFSCRYSTTFSNFGRKMDINSRYLTTCYVKIFTTWLYSLQESTSL